jgi:hypothetical protein
MLFMGQGSSRRISECNRRVIDEPKCFVIPNTEETVTRMVEALAAYWIAEGIAGELDQLEHEETARAMRAVLQSFRQD